MAHKTSPLHENWEVCQASKQQQQLVPVAQNLSYAASLSKSLLACFVSVMAKTSATNVRKTRKNKKTKGMLWFRSIAETFT